MNRVHGSLGFALLVLSSLVNEANASPLIGPKDQNDRQTIEVQGHRGARAVLPENSLAGFAYALEIGADTLELDMAVTADNVVVVSHDQTINQALCQTQAGDEIESNLWIRQLTLQQLRQFDCGSKTHPDFPKQKAYPHSKIPTLGEVFSLVADSPLAHAQTIAFNLETKTSRARENAAPEAAEFIRLVLQQVNAFGFASRVTIQSFDQRTLLAAQRQAPQIHRSLLLRQRPTDWLESARAAHAHIVSPRHNLLRYDDVRLMQNEGLKVIPWTANKISDWQYLLDLEVDGIITDDPAGLLEFLKR